MAGSQPDVLVAPPLLVVEILSPDDTCSETEDRSRDYMKMGMAHRSEDEIRTYVRLECLDLGISS